MHATSQAYTTFVTKGILKYRARRQQHDFNAASSSEPSHDSVYTATSFNVCAGQIPAFIRSEFLNPTELAQANLSARRHDGSLRHPDDTDRRLRVNMVHA